MLFQRRIAFSGTPSSLLPLEMGECVYQQGDDATMLRTLTEPQVVSQLDLPEHESTRSHAAPAKPGAHTHVPPTAHVPWPEQLCTHEGGASAKLSHCAPP